MKNIFRPNILALKPYSCARDEFSGAAEVLLDANELPYNNGVNRYPDPRHSALRGRISELWGVPSENIILGNGSDELIDILIRSTCGAGDRIVVFSPGYSMYEVSAAVNDVEVVKFDLDADFLPYPIMDKAKLLFVCSPNNPVGKAVSLELIREICVRFQGLVVVDEAYVDFADTPSAVGLIDDIPNIFILRTLSKSWGMAGLRIGAGIGRREIIEVLNKVKAPYNIGNLTQEKALELLVDTAGFAARVAEIKRERERLFNEFLKLKLFNNAYPSEANFLLVTHEKYRELYDFLAKNGVIVRLRDIPPLIAGGLRISVGTPAENDKLLKLLDEWRKYYS